MSREEEVLNILRKVKDPHVDGNIVDADMVKDLKIDGKKVKFRFIPPAMGCSGCPAIQFLVDEMTEELNKEGYESEIEVSFE